MKRDCLHCGEEFFMRVALPRSDDDRLCPECLADQDKELAKLPPAQKEDADEWLDRMKDDKLEREGF